MTKQDDMSLRFFLAGEDSVVIAIKQPQNCVVGGLPVTILEDPDVGAVREIVLDALRQSDRTMIGVIVAHEPTGKSNNNSGNIGRRTAADGPILREKEGG